MLTSHSSVKFYSLINAWNRVRHGAVRMSITIVFSTKWTTMLFLYKSVQKMHIVQHGNVKRHRYKSKNSISVKEKGQ